MAAAVCKLMRLQDLVAVAAQMPGRHALPQHDRLAGPARRSGCSPTIRPTIRAASPPPSLDGLLHGAGDAVIGVNPATDSVDSRRARCCACWTRCAQRYAIPTQTCVLAHVTTTLRAIERGAPVDLVFQSIGGTEAANRSFGVTLALLREAREAALSLKRGTIGDNVMYFETGQGSALSADAHHGVDQQTCEARAYAVARRFAPLLVNTRGRLHRPGVPVRRQADHPRRAGGPLLRQAARPADGLDVCYTNHAEADQDDMDALLTLLGAAGVTYIMGVPGADDVMLSLSEHLVPRRAVCCAARSACGRRRNSRPGSHAWASMAARFPSRCRLRCRRR